MSKNKDYIKCSDDLEVARSRSLLIVKVMVIIAFILLSIKIYLRLYVLNEHQSTAMTLVIQGQGHSA